jgi:hypothetical protein
VTVSVRATQNSAAAMPPGRGEQCEVCARRLCPRGGAVTGLCARCRSTGAEFAGRWITDLKSASLATAEIGVIVGLTPDAVRARLSDGRRTWEADR